ncbi:MAG TPA: CBS domain-containing protein [Ignavibacteriaceae bacterium]|nr:CBS domain-containing protein [Ignavibacteriaceae bacterium]
MQSLKELFQNRSLYTVHSGSKLIDVVKYMADSNVGLVPVLQAGKLIGVFSERDLVKRVIAKGLSLEDTIIDDVMTRELILAKSDESYEACLKKMKDAYIRHIIIIDDGLLYGVLSMRDLLEMDITAQKETIQVLNNYIYSR